jgi:hypothetical protein
MSSLSIFQSYAVELEKSVTDALPSTFPAVLRQLGVDYTHNPLSLLETQHHNNAFSNICSCIGWAHIDVDKRKAFCNSPPIYTGPSAGLSYMNSRVPQNHTFKLGVFDGEDVLPVSSKQSFSYIGVSGPTGPKSSYDVVNSGDCSNSSYNKNNAKEIRHVTEWLDRLQRKRDAARELSMIDAHHISFCTTDTDTYGNIQHLIEEHHERIKHPIRECPLVFCDIEKASDAAFYVLIIYNPTILKENALKTKLIRFLLSLLQVAKKEESTSLYPSSIKYRWKHYDTS